MATLPIGTYLFTHYGFTGEDLAPQLVLLADASETFTTLLPQNKSFTITFDRTKHFCSGWHDLATGESFPCPDRAKVPEPYEQCRHCQRKTGFNPAFYNAPTVSTQQEARNLEPHILYIAHFGSHTMKVGISWAGRGIRRLLDQGARSGLIIKTFPTANVARHYEALIAKLPGIAETIQLKTKYQLLRQPYDQTQATTELLATRQRLIAECKLTPDMNQPLTLDPYYLGAKLLKPTALIDLLDKDTVSGACLGMVGSAMIFEQDDLQYLFSIGHRSGYRVTISEEQTVNKHQPHQASLF